jgi:hypothetical protein
MLAGCRLSSGRIHYTPAAEQHLQDLDDWDHQVCVGRDRSALRVGDPRPHRRHPGVPVRRPTARRRPTGHADEHLQKKKALVAYEVDESSGERVANAWQESQRRPSVINARQRVCAGQQHNAANDDRQQPLSVPRFPWYC